MLTRRDYEECVMPGGDRCFYRDSDHSYWGVIHETRDGWKGKDRLTGISTCAGGLEYDPEGLMRWAAKTSLEGVAELMRRPWASAEWLTNGAAMWKELEAKGLTYTAIRDRRATEGTNVHKHALHALAKGKPVPDYEEMTEVERGYARGITQFWLDHEPDVLQAEQVVVNKGLKVAGRFDLRYRHSSSEATMIDAKTSSFISLKHHVQVAGYDFCASRCGFGRSAKLMILQVDAEGGYELIPVRATPLDFVLAADAYRRAKRIKQEATEDRRIREAAHGTAV